MGDDADINTADLAKVEFPAKYLHCLSDFLHSLRARILEQAARQAKSRTRRDGLVVASKEDVLPSARNALGPAADEFEGTLSNIEPDYVRSAS